MIITRRCDSGERWEKSGNMRAGDWSEKEFLRSLAYQEPIKMSRINSTGPLETAPANEAMPWFMS